MTALCPEKHATPLTQGTPDATLTPVIRTITFADLHDALRLGWEDFKAVPSHPVILCLYVIYPVLSLVLVGMLGYSVVPLLFPLVAGFALIGPFAALGLYELSRRKELGETTSAWHAIQVLRSPSFGAMLGLGTLLLMIFVVWVATAQGIYVLTFGNAPPRRHFEFRHAGAHHAGRMGADRGRLRRGLSVRGGGAVHQCGVVSADA